MSLCAPQRECISIHIGQAGCQIGNACWELYWCVFYPFCNKREILFGGRC